MPVIHTTRTMSNSQRRIDGRLSVVITVMSLSSPPPDEQAARSSTLDIAVGFGYSYMVNLTREQRIACHKDFLIRSGRALSVFAGDNYQKSGRGMVVVPEEDIIDADSSIPPRLSYATKGSGLLTEISLHFEPQEWGWLATYDPDMQVIVIVVRADVGTSGYLVGKTPRRMA
jgi:hypothetical protein